MDSGWHHRSFTIGWRICLFPLDSGRWLDILRVSDTTRRTIEVVIHIDDGIIAGPPTQMTEIKQILQGGASMKDLGSIDKHGKKYLGKIIKRTAKGFTIQADPEFYDRLLEETGLDQGVSSPTPGTNAMKPTAEWEKEAWDEDLDKNSHKTLSEDSRNATVARGRETRHHVRREECFGELAVSKVSTLATSQVPGRYT